MAPLRQRLASSRSEGVGWTSQASSGRPATAHRATVPPRPSPNELIPRLQRPQQTQTLTARPPGPGSGSIRPKTTNKEEAGVSLRGRREARAAPEGTYTARGVVTRTCGFSPTGANSSPGLDATSAPRPGSRWCTAASRARPVTKGQGVGVGLGESSEPREPRLCARPAARTRPLPARHSAPRASTARGAAEPSRRAASAPGSPWPHSPGAGDPLGASLPRAVRGCSR